MKTLALIGAALLPAAALAQDRALVVVNGKPIPQQAVIERLWNLYGNNTLDQMVQEELIRQAIEKSGVKPDKKEVDRRMKGIRDRFGEKDAWEASLKKAGTNEAALRAQIEDQVVREQLVIQARKLEVTEKDVKDYFEANKEKLASPESIRLRHLLVANEQQAKDLRIALKAGADFAKLARELSLDTASKENGGDLGFISKGILVPDIENVAFSIKPGEVSEVISTNLGFHLLKVEERRTPEPANFKKIKDDLQRALLANKINQAWPEYLKSMKEAAKIDTPPATAGGGAGAPAQQ